MANKVKKQKRPLFSVYFILLLAFEPCAFSADLSIYAPHAEGNQGVADFRARFMPSAKADFQISTADKSAQVIAAKIKAKPMNLWILVDTSNLCKVQKVDESMNQMIHSLKQSAHRDTLITLVGYNGDTSDTLYQQQPLSELDGPELQCGARSLSSSYEKPLQKLMQANSPKHLPLVVWVFTSGNIEISKTTASQLRERATDITIVLYNEFIEKDVRPIFEQTLSVIGERKLQFGVLTKSASVNMFPSMLYEVQFSIPSRLQGKDSPFQLSLKQGDNVLANSHFSLSTPLSPFAWFWNKFGRSLTIALTLLGIAYLIFRIIRYYRPGQCPRCEKRLAFRTPSCLFCEPHPFLVGNFRPRRGSFGAAAKRPTANVLPLLDDKTELGSHRKSLIRLRKQNRQACLATITREIVGNEGVAYLLSRSGTEAHIEVKVNGVPVMDRRYLASGDELLIDTTQMTFFSGGKL